MVAVIKKNDVFIFMIRGYRKGDEIVKGEMRAS